MQNSTNGHSKAEIFKQVKEYLGEFVNLQRLLLASFKDTYPQVKDWENLLDFPRQGSIYAVNDRWFFYLHGCGLRFENQAGVIIDAHNFIEDNDIIDAWRLLQYLESIGVLAEDEVSLNDIKMALSELAFQRILKCMYNDNEKYKLL